MAEGNGVRVSQGETADTPVNITKKNGVILMLERRLEDIQSRQDYLMTAHAHQTINPAEIKREHCKLYRERQNVEGKLQMALEEAEKRGLNKKDWTVGSKTTYDSKTLDYVQFCDKGYQVILLAVNHQGDTTKGMMGDCLKDGPTVKFIEEFIELVQGDDQFHPVPASIHILKALCDMAQKEKNDKARRIGRMAEEMLSRIEETRPRVIITGRAASAS